MSNVGFDTWFKKSSPKTVFIIKNIAPRGKTIRILGIPVKNNCIYDLLSVNYISEADIRHSLLKGDLKVKAENGEIVIIESNIDLLQFDTVQKSFLESIGITEGLEVSSDGYGSLPVNFKENILLIGTKDGVNRVFSVPSPDKFINGNFQNSQLSISVYHNGKLLEQNVDYVVAESGGTGTGYDLVVFLQFSPISQSTLIANYQTEIQG